MYFKLIKTRVYKQDINCKEVDKQEINFILNWAKRWLVGW